MPPARLRRRPDRGRCAAAGTSGAAVPVIAVADNSNRRCDRCVTGTIDRAQLRMVQTRRRSALPSSSMRNARRRGGDDFTDDAALAEWAGLKVTTFKVRLGVKLTTDDDTAAPRWLTWRLGRCAHWLWLRRPQFGDGDHVMLGGVRIPRGGIVRPFRRRCRPSLVDAILGALSGDIGVHFPPTDARWRGASSDRFFAFAVERVHARGGRIAPYRRHHRLRAPRIGPHRDQMRTRIAERRHTH